MHPKLLDVYGILLYSYPLFIGLSWGLAYRLGEKAYPDQLGQKRYNHWFVGLFISSWLGAKLLFVVTQDQWTSTELMLNSNFWLGGGFVYLGGLLAGSGFTFIFAGIHQLPLRTFEFSVVPLLLGHALGRIGCFLAGCCYGSESTLPWAVYLHQAHRHPVQLYEALGLLILALWIRSRAQDKMIHYLAGYGTLRFGLEYLRGDEIRGALAGVSTSQLVSLGLLGLAIVLKFNPQVLKITRKN